MLSVLCVTRAKPYVLPFLEEIVALSRELNAECVFGAHGSDVEAWARTRTNRDYGVRLIEVQGEYLEQMLTPALEACSGNYILRLDDDERCGPGMIEWLRTEQYRKHPNWHFARVHIWPDAEHYIANPPFYPDFQGRLSIPSQAARPVLLHAGPSYPSYPAPLSARIEHHCFMLKSYEERKQLDLKYREIASGQPARPGVVYPVFPEDAIQANLDIRVYP